MRTIETKVYQYSELSDQAKEKAREWYRNCDTDSFYAESVIEDAKECAAILGIEVDKVYYSGFWSQGDGACFTGGYEYAKGAAKAIAKHTGNDAELVRIAKALQEAQRKQFYKLGARIEHRGHYYHSGCMSIDVRNMDDNYRDISDIEEDVMQALRDFADWIYNQLEKDYDYQNSDDVIAENIEANEYEFNEDGGIA